MGVKGKEEDDYSYLAQELNKHVLYAMIPDSCTKNQAWRFPRARSTRAERLAPNSKMLARHNDSGENKRSRLKLVGTLLDSAMLLRH